MYRSDSSRGYQMSRDSSRSDTRRRVGRNSSVESYVRLRPKPQYVPDTDIGYASSTYSRRTRRSSSTTTYASADEGPSLEAMIAQAVRRDREEQRLKVERKVVSASYSEYERHLPQPLYNPVIEEDRHQIPRRMSNSASGYSMRNPSVSSNVDYMAPASRFDSRADLTATSSTYRSGSVSKQSPPSRSLGRGRRRAERSPPQQLQNLVQVQLPMPQRPDARLDTLYVNHQHEHVHQHFHHISPTRSSSGKGPTFVSRGANGRLQFERCSMGKSHAR
ncbi:hypothetical protein OHC33_003412 [Knufia fluminis]|uniref:Uncharacterized protein n=1 Tax=Knufia fluminis TaxID=191047 RepID=A0AAN8EXF3_9EURO|nr:hypothetical protein OHC33_003412 [Knufia fluminis]